MNCYYIGMDDVIANAFIESMKQNGNRFLTYEQIYDYGDKAVGLVRKDAEVLFDKCSSHCTTSCSVTLYPCRTYLVADGDGFDFGAEVVNPITRNPSVWHRKRGNKYECNRKRIFIHPCRTNDIQKYCNRTDKTLHQEF